MAKVLVVGDVSLDRILDGDLVKLRSNDSGTFVLSGHEKDEAGLSAKVAIRLADLNHEVKLCSVTSDDQDGFDLYDMLDEAGVIQVEKYVCRLKSLSRTLTRRKYCDMNIEHFVVHPDWPGVDFHRAGFDREIVKEARAWADIVIVQNFGFGVVTQKLSDELSEVAASRDKPIYFNQFEYFDLVEE